MLAFHLRNPRDAVLLPYSWNISTICAIDEYLVCDRLGRSHWYLLSSTLSLVRYPQNVRTTFDWWNARGKHYPRFLLSRNFLGPDIDGVENSLFWFLTVFDCFDQVVADLAKQGLDVPKTCSLEYLDQLHSRLELERDAVLQRPRRQCMLGEYPDTGGSTILGKVEWILGLKFSFLITLAMVSETFFLACLQAKFLTRPEFLRWW